MRTALLIFVATLSWSGSAYAEDRAPGDTTSQAAPPAIPYERPVLSQGDPQWASLRFGGTTVKKSGCLAFALLDVLMTMGFQFTSPAAFIAELTESKLFTRDGNLRWDLDKRFPVIATRLLLRGDAAYREALKQLSNGNSVLLQIATNHGTMHWVAAYGFDNGEIQIRDSNGGRIGLLSELYGVSALRGLATLTAK